MKIEITPMTMEQAEEKGITSWSIWTCEISAENSNAYNRSIYN